MKIAIVTGASSGIGTEFVRQIPGCYHKLDEIWVVARNTARLEALKEEMEESFPEILLRIFDGDLKRDYIYHRIGKELTAKKPIVRMLVTSAGVGKTGRFAELDSKVIDDMIDLNCSALTKMVSLCLPYCAKGSRILNVASASAFFPQPNFAIYAATKSYVLSFSRALSMELEKEGIVVTAVCPGPVETPFLKTAGNDNNDAKKAVMAQPEEVVKQALLDTKKRKEISIYGLPMKGAKILGKLLPDAWLRYVIKMIN